MTYTAAELIAKLEKTGTPYFELRKGNRQLFISHRSELTPEAVVVEIRNGEWYSSGIFTKREIREFEQNEGFEKII